MSRTSQACRQGRSQAAEKKPHLVPTIIKMGLPGRGLDVRRYCPGALTCKPVFQQGFSLSLSLIYIYIHIHTRRYASNKQAKNTTDKKPHVHMCIEDRGTRRPRNQITSRTKGHNPADSPNFKTLTLQTQLQHLGSAEAKRVHGYKLLCEKILRRRLFKEPVHGEANLDPRLSSFFGSSQKHAYSPKTLVTNVNMRDHLQHRLTQLSCMARTQVWNNPSSGLEAPPLGRKSDHWVYGYGFWGVASGLGVSGIEELPLPVRKALKLQVSSLSCGTQAAFSSAARKGLGDAAQ